MCGYRPARCLRTLLLAFGVAAWAPVSSYAMCTDDRHPSVQEEYASSKLVLIGRVESQSILVSPDDPEGVDAYLYAVKPVRMLKGSLKKNLTLRSDSGSSSFAMEVGKEYLLFVSVYPDMNFIDNCGNSGLVSKKQDVLSALRRERHAR